MTSRDARHAVITGAAAGIGRATTLALLREGWSVTALDRDEQTLAGLAADPGARAAGERLATGVLDVTDAAAFDARVAEAVERAGRLDVLVNNAGLLVAGPFEDVEPDRHQREVAVNVNGVLHGLHAGFRHLQATAQRHGVATVVNLGSASAIYGQAELANYSATKFYVRGLTEALDLEWRRHGIRVVDLWPLFVQTGMLDGVTTGTTSSLGVRLQADDIAAAVLRAIDPPRSARLLQQVHFPVGTQSRVLTVGSRFSPGWLTRSVNRRLARH